MSAEYEVAEGVGLEEHSVGSEAGEAKVCGGFAVSGDDVGVGEVAAPVELTVSEEIAAPADRDTLIDCATPAEQASVGVGPWPGGREAWPEGDQYDPELLEHGDRRNVEDQYRYWTVEAISANIAAQTLPFEVAIENLGHDFNIGSIVRTANALGARRVHIVGRRRWNRRGAMVTDRYMQVVHHEDVAAFIADCRGRGLDVVGIDNTEGSLPIESDELRGEVVLLHD